MSTDFDAVIVGSGPAGVSVAFPLVEAGLKVLIVDGGRDVKVLPPSQPYLESRSKEQDQWNWMIGKDFHALKNWNAASPKLRVPVHAPVFEGFATENKIDPSEFITVGSLAKGGMSNAWGCGVARFSATELREFPFTPSEIEKSYETVGRRIGLSGGAKDDLSDYFGLDELADPPVQMDALHSYLLNKYETNRATISSLGLLLGHSRLAVLSRDREARKACDLSGNCLWGCHRRALYSATEDIAILRQYPNFTYRSGFIVDRLVTSDGYPAIAGRDISGNSVLTGRKVILGAGTLATTRLALQALNYSSAVSMQACPTAAFMLWLPKALGYPSVPAFGFGQLSCTLDMPDGIKSYGALFNVTGIPVAEFSRYMPLRKRYGVDFLKALLSSCVVGNIFLPGHLTSATLAIGPEGRLRIDGTYDARVNGLMTYAKKITRMGFFKAGALMLPNSFTIAKPGSDIHYASSIPMSRNPVLGKSDPFGAVIGLQDVHIVDGACLTSLPAKPHTLTIMANADRIGRRLTVALLRH